MKKAGASFKSGYSHASQGTRYFTLDDFLGAVNINQPFQDKKSGNNYDYPVEDPIEQFGSRQVPETNPSRMKFAGIRKRAR